jgi:hypothetical protein
MAFVKLSKADETGESAGALFINTDQIIAISMGANTTEIATADGHNLWVKETVDQVISLLNARS